MGTPFLGVEELVFHFLRSQHIFHGMVSDVYLGLPVGDYRKGRCKCALVVDVYSYVPSIFE